jgi:uncharacterized phiE125 gp8 family phage protein
MKIVLDTAPVVEPITVQSVKEQLRIDYSDEDDYIDLCISTARVWAEEYTNRKLITQTWNLYLDRFPFEIVVPFGSLQSINSIQYYDTNNALQTLPSNEYDVDTAAVLGKIRPADGYSWPAVYNRYNPIVINFDCGYGDTAARVPAPIVHGLKYTVAQLFENRESMQGLPDAVKSLLFPYIIFNYGDS